MNYDYTIFVHSRASDCRKEGAYAFVSDHKDSEEIIKGKIEGPSLTSIRAHLICVICALKSTPGNQEKILLISNLEAFVSPFHSADLTRRLRKGILPNSDLWAKIFDLTRTRRIDVRSVSIKSSPPEQLLTASKASLRALREENVKPDVIDEIMEYPDLFSTRLFNDYEKE